MALIHDQQNGQRPNQSKLVQMKYSCKAITLTISSQYRLHKSQLITGAKLLVHPSSLDVKVQ